MHPENLTKVVLAAIALATAVPALAQDNSQKLPADTAIPSLMFFTFGALLVVLAASLAWFLRKRSNREATERGLGLDDKPLDRKSDKRSV